MVGALIHLWSTPEHLQDWWGYGAFFLATTLAQGLFVITFLRWPETQMLLFAGIVGNLAIVFLYVLVHYSKATLGPMVAHRGDLGVLGILATAAELGLVVLLATLLAGAYRRATYNGLFLAGVLLWTLKLSGILA